MDSVVFLKRTYEIRVCIYQAAYENTLVRFIQGVLLVHEVRFRIFRKINNFTF